MVLPGAMRQPQWKWKWSLKGGASWEGSMGLAAEMALTLVGGVLTVLGPYLGKLFAWWLARSTKQLVYIEDPAHKIQMEATVPC
jgi:hypothetical protein